MGFQGPCAVERLPAIYGAGGFEGGYSWGMQRVGREGEAGGVGPPGRGMALARERGVAGPVEKPGLERDSCEALGGTGAPVSRAGEDTR